MKRVLFFLLLLAIGAGAFVALALNLESLSPIIVHLGLEPDSWIVEELLSVIGVFFIGVPLAALLWAVADLGTNAASADTRGNIVLRLKSGTRYTFAVVSLTLAAVSFFSLVTDEETTLAYRMVAPIFGAAFAFAAYLLLVAKVRYDDSVVCATHFTGRLRRHNWADLVRIRTNAEGREYILEFCDQRKARVSFYYQDVLKLITLAQRKLEQNA